MKRLILMLALSIITLQATWAKLTVTQETDGTVVFTLEASGDINNEFTPVSGEYAKYTPSDLIKDYLTTTKLKVVTKTGVTMSNEDLKRICGMADEENNFPNLNTLDLEFANFTNDNDLGNLKYMDQLKTITFPRTTKEIPQGCLNYGSCKIENVIIPIIAKEKQEQISKLLIKSKRLRNESKVILKKAVNSVEMAIEYGEDKAIAYLNS